MTAKRRRQGGGANGASDLERTLTWSDIAGFAEAIRLGQHNLLAAANVVRETYSLGPRGVWIIGKIATGRVKTQSDVVKAYGVGRSIIAEEMAILTRNGLVVAEQSPTDRRQLNLSLTPLGEEANKMLGEALEKRIRERLGGIYDLQDIRFCTELLRRLGDEAADEARAE
jgi:DNA-binding MarR family transcriptional regulator